MSWFRRLPSSLAILLLIALPLRTLASVEMAAPHAGHASMDATHDCDPMPGGAVASMDHGDDGATRGPHGSCGDCCSAAVVATQGFLWTPSRASSHPRPASRAWAAPTVVPDGLDRPPRSLA